MITFDPIKLKQLGEQFLGIDIYPEWSKYSRTELANNFFPKYLSKTMVSIYRKGRIKPILQSDKKLKDSNSFLFVYHAKSFGVEYNVLSSEATLFEFNIDNQIVKTYNLIFSKENIVIVD